MRRADVPSCPSSRHRRQGTRAANERAGNASAGRHRHGKNVDSTAGEGALQVLASAEGFPDLELPFVDRRRGGDQKEASVVSETAGLNRQRGTGFCELEFTRLVARCRLQW